MIKKNNCALALFKSTTICFSFIRYSGILPAMLICSSFERTFQGSIHTILFLLKTFEILFFRDFKTSICHFRISLCKINITTTSTACVMQPS